jgi:TonB-dependent receptor
VPDKTALFDLISTNPAYFAQTEAQRAGDLDAILNGDQDVEEDIRAGYVMANTRVGRWSFQAGVRYEGTETMARTKIRVPDSENPFPANTINRIRHRWSQGTETEEGSYDDILPSAAATFDLSRDLKLKFGYHKAIKRAPLDQLAGQWEIDEANLRVSMPNASLEPERSEKFSAMLEYYFEPAGTASIHVFKADLENSSERTDYLPASEFGFGDDPFFGDFEFRSWKNFPGIRKLDGIELAYIQQLTFFRNEFLRGTSVFATYSAFTSDPEPDNFVPQVAAAGITLNYRGFSASLKGTWTPDLRTGSNTVPTANNSYFFPGDLEYKQERYIFDIDVSYEFSRRLTLFVAARNAFNEGTTWYYPN